MCWNSVEFSPELSTVLIIYKFNFDKDAYVYVCLAFFIFIWAAFIYQFWKRCDTQFVMGFFMPGVTYPSTDRKGFEESDK